MTIPNIRHEIIELVQCNARRELFPRVVDFCGTVKILFNIIALYQADKYVLPRIHNNKSVSLFGRLIDFILDYGIRILLKSFEQV